MKKIIFALVLLIIVVFTASYILAHEAEEEVADISSDMSAWSAIPFNLWLVAISGIAFILVLLIATTLFKKKLKEVHKKIIYILVFIVTVAITFYLVGATIYTNVISETKGPVHWHADYEVWVCEEEFRLPPPRGFTNRIGTETFHDHGDNRIHVEGILLKREHASLGTFFAVVGGLLTEDEIIFPTSSGIVRKHDGDLCNGKPGKLYVFVNGELISNPDDYVIAPYETIPPGDTIKFVFSSKSLEEIDPYIKSYGREEKI